MKAKKALSKSTIIESVTGKGGKERGKGGGGGGKRKGRRQKAEGVDSVDQ